MYKHWDWQTQTPYDNCSWWIPPYSLQWRKWQRRGLYLASVVIFYDGDDDDDVICMIFLQKHSNRVWLLEHKPSCFWSDCWRAGSEPDAQQTLSGICSMNQVSGQEPNCIANLIRYLGIRYQVSFTGRIVVWKPCSIVGFPGLPTVMQLKGLRNVWCNPTQQVTFSFFEPFPSMIIIIVIIIMYGAQTLLNK